VTIEATIAPDGRVTAAAVVGAPSVLDESALAAVRQWEFEPTIVDGAATSIIMKVALNFGYR
jgi:TonB family protein